MKKLLEVLKSILAILCVIISLVGFTAFIALNSAAKIGSKENISNMIKKVSITELVNENDVEEIYASFEEAGIPRKYLQPVLDNQELKEFVAEVSSNVITAIVDQKDLPKIDRDKAIKLLKETVNDVLTEFDDVTEEEKEKILSDIDRYTKEINEALDEVETQLNQAIKESNVMEELGANRLMLKVLQYRIISLIIAIFCWGLIVALKYKDQKFMKWLGITSILQAVILAAATIIVTVIWNSIDFSDIKAFKDSLDVSVNMIIRNFVIGGISFLIVGIGTLIVKKIINKKKMVEVTE